MLHDHQQFSPAGAGRQSSTIEPYFTGRFPEGYRPPELQPGYRPGERMLRGSPLVFNSALLSAYEADRRIARGLPADLSALTYDELARLMAAYLNAWARRRGDLMVAAFGEAVCDERARRPEYRAAYGRRA